MQERTITSTPTMSDPPTAALRAIPAGRRHVLTQLRNRPASIPELARSLERSPMTIRHHLARLEADGLVEAAGERRSGGAGRPATLYRTSGAAEDLFPSAGNRLARLLLDELSEYFGEDDRAAAFFTERLARRAASPHLEWLVALPTSERVQAAAGILQREDGELELVETEGGTELRDHRCAYRGLLRGGLDDGACRFHARYVEALVGAPVALTACQAGGDPSCCFRIEHAPPVSAPGEGVLRATDEAARVSLH